MKKIKALWWTTFGVINVYGIFLLMVYIIFMKTSGDPLNLILYQIFLSICGVLPVVIAVLAILNVKACLKYREELMAEPPVKMNLVMKFALIPFFIMNFLFWMIVGMYAILFWFRWVLVGGQYHLQYRDAVHPFCRRSSGPHGCDIKGTKIL